MKEKLPLRSTCVKRRKKGGLKTFGTKSFLICFLISALNGQLFAATFQQDPITVTGQVTDSNRMPLPGVSVVEKGTNNGTETDFNGNFTIEVPSSDAVLVFSFVGMASMEQTVGENTILNIELQDDLQALDEVVLVAYGDQRKIGVVGSQSTINPTVLQQPVSNLSTMLAGRVAGLTGVQRSGLPGYDGADIWIRGISTFTSAGTSPLILVDGVERSMNNIDPRDIEAFSVLKDAAATAVYGVRGANGVILIETKKGQVGKPQVKVEYSEGFTSFTKTPELVDGITYMELANEALTTRGGQPNFSQETIDRTRENYDPLLYPNVDWMDVVFRDFGRNRNANVNVSGGAERAVYYVSLSYFDETGLFETNDLENYNSETGFKRYNVTSNLNLDITETTNVQLGIQGYLSEGNYPEVSVSSIFSSVLEVSPVEYPVMYPGGFVPGRSANGGLRNPYADLTKRGFKNEIKNQIYSNLRITQELDELTEGLSWTGLFSFDAYNAHTISRGKREATYFVDQNYPYTQDGELVLFETYPGQNYLGYNRSNGGNRRVYMETALNYDRSFGKHHIGALILANRTDYVDAFAGDFTSSLPFRNQGLASRLSYSYDDRYFIEFNGGYNGSENFAPENRYGFFPSIGLGWVLSNEEFFQSDVIDFLKFRYSDGIVGSSSGAGRFAYLSRVEDGQANYYFGENPQSTSGIAETYQGVSVTWAESRKRDLGIELNAFDNKLNLTVDFFEERTEGAFLPRRDIPNYIGLVSDPYGNIGITENKGFDGTLEYRTFIKDFNFSFRGTFSYNENKVLENGEPEQPYAWLNHRGDPILATYGLIAERLFTLDDDIDGDGFITADDGFPTQYGQIQPGDIKYKDLNGDGQIDSYDRKLIGSGDVPELTIGFGISTEYKGFDLSMFFQGQYGASRPIGGNGIIPFGESGGRGNIYTVSSNPWTMENDDAYATTPRLSYGASGIGQSNNEQTSTWWMRDIEFLRLKTAEFGYTIPSQVTDRWNLGVTRVYLRGTNLFTISEFDLWDPELNTSNGNQYPNVSTVALGVSLQF